MTTDKTIHGDPATTEPSTELPFGGLPCIAVPRAELEEVAEAIEKLLAWMPRINRTHPHGEPGSPVRMNQQGRICAEDAAIAALAKLTERLS